MSSNISVNLLKLQRSIPASGSSNTVSDEFLAITDAISILFSSPPESDEETSLSKYSLEQSPTLDKLLLLKLLFSFSLFSPHNNHKLFIIILPHKQS